MKDHSSRLTKLEKQHAAPAEKIDEIKIVFVEGDNTQQGKSFMSIPKVDYRKGLVEEILPDEKP